MILRPVLGALALGLVVALGAANAQQGTRAPARPQHGTPAGWKFTWPKGDKAKVGPELSMMGPLHDALYFAEASSIRAR